MTPNPTTILITGFGPFLKITTNPSFEIVRNLPNQITHHGQEITIHAHPTPLKVSYHDCASLLPSLLTEKEWDVVIHIGLDVESSYFHIEKGAMREGYHTYPTEDRKVFTKAENKKLWGKSPDRLEGGFDFDTALEVWRREVCCAKGKEKGKGKGKGQGNGKVGEEELRVTDEVGSYICGFVYYFSLEGLWKENKTRKVMFLHVPMLEGLDEVEKGVGVVLGLVRALVEQREG
jgi:pyroglutamyl-peptidase